MNKAIKTQSGKTAGVLLGDTYHTKRRASIHLLRHPLAWAIDCDILNRLRAAGVRRVVIHEAETGRDYAAPLGRIIERGIRIERGFGPQIALHLDLWDAPGADNGEQLELPFGAGEGKRW